MIESIYKPDIAIHPGKTLQGILDSAKMTQADLAQRTGLTKKTINEIIQGKNPTTPDSAIKFSKVFGMSVAFWNNLQNNYDATKARLQSEKKLTEELRLLEKFTCYDELADWGYVERSRTPGEKLANLLGFFRVSSLGLIPDVHGIAFRQSYHKGLSYEALASWLRCGEIVAGKIETERFNRSKLIDSIGILRRLTKESYKTFPEKLVKICAASGVAVAMVSYFKNTNVNGATRWLNQDKAIIQLNLRGKHVDIFWFTFFHELGHVLLHGKKDEFIEFLKTEKRLFKHKEAEADRFASNTLIPEAKYSKFVSKGDINVNTIRVFADELGIAPSIVAGRLAHESGEWGKFNSLRPRLQFTISN